MSISVTFTRSPLGKTLVMLVVASVLVVFGKWDSLSSHARGLILGAYGISILGAMLIQMLRTRRLLKNGVVAEGTVVGAEEGIGTGRTASTTYNPVVRFITVDGRTVEFTSTVGYGTEPDVGSYVNVRYLPNDLEQAEIDRPIVWIVPAVFGLVGGLGLLVAGALVYVGDDDDAGAVARITASTGATSSVDTSSPTKVPADTPVVGSWHRA